MIFELNGKAYKMIEEPKKDIGGKWSLLFKDNIYVDVKSYHIKKDLNIKFFFIKDEIKKLSIAWGDHYGMGIIEKIQLTDQILNIYKNS